METLGWKVGRWQGDTRLEHQLLPLLLLSSCCCYRRLAWISCPCCWAAGSHGGECGGSAAQAAAQHLQYRLGFPLQDRRGVAVRQHCQLFLSCRVTQQYQLHGCLERVIYPPHFPKRQHLAGGRQHVALQAPGRCCRRSITRFLRACLCARCSRSRQLVAGREGSRLQFLAGSVQHTARAVPAGWNVWQHMHHTASKPTHMI
jgi:hypothetical protein